MKLIDTEGGPTITTLAEKAMLVRLKRSMWQPYAYDEAATRSAGGRTLGRFNKKLCASAGELAAVNAAYTDLYRYVIDNTVPWLDDGVRMLSSSHYFDFSSGVRHRVALCDNEVNKLVAAWPDIIQKDKERFDLAALQSNKPSMFNATDYPTDIAACFDVQMSFYPVPDVGDFRVEISDDDKQSMVDAIKSAEVNVTKYMLGELLGPVSKFVEKLSVPIGEEGAIFRNSLIENVLDVANRIPALNITNDETVTKIAGQIKDVMLIHLRNPDVLRESPVVRTAVKDKMDALKNSIAEYMNGVHTPSGVSCGPQESATEVAADAEAAEAGNTAA